MKPIFAVVCIAFVAWLSWLSLSNEPANSAGSNQAGEAQVVRVVDGDTVVLLIQGQRENVRLIGIDTPESVSRSVPDQCYGSEASEALTGLLPPQSTVRIERGPEARDRYGRLLLYLYRAEDDLFVNQWLVEGGFADAVSYPPNDAYSSHFSKLKGQAKADRRGLWGVCDGPDQPLN